MQAEDIMQKVQDIHAQLHKKIEESNRRYKKHVDEHICKVIFKVGDYVLVIITRSHLSIREQRKLDPPEVGPSEIIEQINDNAYHLKLPSHIRTHDIFDIKHLVPYHGDTYDE